MQEDLLGGSQDQKQQNPQGLSAWWAPGDLEVAQLKNLEATEQGGPRMQRKSRSKAWALTEMSQVHLCIGSWRLLSKKTMHLLEQSGVSKNAGNSPLSSLHPVCKPIGWRHA